MRLSNRQSLSYRPLLVLVFSLLLVNAYGVKAQTNPGPASPAATSNPTPSSGSGAAPDSKGGTNQSPTPTPSAVDVQREKLIATTWYPVVVSLLFGALVIGFAGTIARVILRSRSSFRSPLGMPDGSLRAMLAFMLVAFLGFYVYASILSLSDFRLPDSLLGIIATVVGFYFGSRASEGAGAASGQSGAVDGTVVDNTGAPAGGATVELSKAGAKTLTKKADASGKFKFDDVATGDYEIKASLAGHTASDPLPVKVTPGATQTVSLKLKP